MTLLVKLGIATVRTFKALSKLESIPYITLSLNI